MTIYQHMRVSPAYEFCAFGDLRPGQVGRLVTSGFGPEFDAKVILAVNGRSQDRVRPAVVLGVERASIVWFDPEETVCIRYIGQASIHLGAVSSGSSYSLMVNWSGGRLLASRSGLILCAVRRETGAFRPSDKSFVRLQDGEILSPSSPDLSPPFFRHDEWSLSAVDLAGDHRECTTLFEASAG